MDELLARLRAIQRRGTSGEAAVVETQQFTIDLTAKRATTNDDVDVHLDPKEWQLVELLVRKPGKLVSQRQVLQEVWGPQYQNETDYLRVFIAAVRRKLEPEPGRPGTSSPNRGWGIGSSPRADERTDRHAWWSQRSRGPQVDSQSAAESSSSRSSSPARRRMGLSMGLLGRTRSWARCREYFELSELRTNTGGP